MSDEHNYLICDVCGRRQGLPYDEGDACCCGGILRLDLDLAERIAMRIEAGFSEEEAEKLAAEDMRKVWEEDGA